MPRRLKKPSILVKSRKGGMLVKGGILMSRVTTTKEVLRWSSMCWIMKACRVVYSQRI